MTSDPWACLSDDDRLEMDTRASAISCLYIAAEEYNARKTKLNWISLQRTRHRARYAGIDDTTIRQTEQLAKEKP